MIEALFGAAQAFFQPAYTGLIPQTVPEPLIQDAKALTETMANLAFLRRPGARDALVLGVGAGEAFALDAATFVLSALLRARPSSAGAAAPVDAPERPRCSASCAPAGARSARARGCG